jgi:hypothetical protein
MSLELFRIVALAKPDSDILINKTGLSRKQYYSRMSSMMNAGLIRRKKWKIYFDSLWQGDLPHDINNN